MKKRPRDKHNPTAGIKGFVILECEACGRVRSTFLKEPITQHRCTCGHETELLDITPLYAHCECGENWRFRTNSSERQITVRCPRCGYPIETEINRRRSAYVTMK